ncbi:histidine phosphatase superfamily [Xylariales sp. PMI_506]|nr:histidine phosphatase superfamily [Xylariales sp. PMI_506]
MSQTDETKPVKYNKFSYVSGFFFTDYATAGIESRKIPVTTQPRLGILERRYDLAGSASLRLGEGPPQWARFADYIDRLNSQSPDGVCYKLIYVIRHGRGVHNVVMEEVGSEAWKKHWSHLEGDSERTWVDARLVEDGIAQAEGLARFWSDAAQGNGMPIPQSLYTSPLARCLETTRLVYRPMMAAAGGRQPLLRPVIKESLRERVTTHTCDKRSSRSWIESNYPEYHIGEKSTSEGEFAEDDVFWSPGDPETEPEHTARMQALLEDIFTNDKAHFISFTTHSYTISSILQAIGGPQLRVAECAMIPLFIKAEAQEPPSHS